MKFVMVVMFTMSVAFASFSSWSPPQYRETEEFGAEIVICYLDRLCTKGEVLDFMFGAVIFPSRRALHTIEMVKTTIRELKAQDQYTSNDAARVHALEESIPAYLFWHLKFGVARQLKYPVRLDEG